MFPRSIRSLASAIAIATGSPHAIAQDCGPRWTGWGTVPGANGPINAAAILPDGNLVIAGQFTSVNGVTVTNAARWDGFRWWAMGAELRAQVQCLAVGTNGTLYAGGLFPIASSSAFFKAAKWNGTGWVSVPNLGTTGTGGVYAMAPLPGGDMLFCGDFSAFVSFNVRPSRIVKYTTAGSLAALGSGANAPVRAVAVSPTGNIVVAGDFDGVAGVTTRRIARWDGAAWQSLGTGLDGFPTTVLCPDDQTIIVAGAITAAGGSPVQGVARWNGTSWEAMGSLPPAVRTLALDSSGTIHAAGGMGILDGTPGARVVRWSGSQWSAIDSGLNGEVRSMLLMPDNRLAAVGTFTRASTLEFDRLAFWGGQHWSGLNATADATVWSIATSPDGRTFLGGQLGSTDLFRFLGICAAGSTGFEALAGGNQSIGGAVYSMTPARDGSMIVAGFFSSAGGSNALNIARWSPSGWSSLPGLNSAVYATAISSSGELIAGGMFTGSGSTSLSRVARWDGSSWRPMGSGFNGAVYALAAEGGRLYAGGQFSHSGALAMNSVAEWTGSTWQSLGSGISGGLRLVYALASLDDGSLAAGGSFANAGGIPAGGLAKWNNQAWSPIGTGVAADEAIYALATERDGSLLIGGDFSSINSVQAHNIARWRNSQFSEVMGGVDGPVFAIGSTPGGPIVGGAFANAGGYPIPWAAKFSDEGSPWLARQPIGGVFDCGSTVTLQAAADANVSRTQIFAWTHNGVAIDPAASGVVISSTPTGSTLVISALSIETSGLWACTATNECGSTTSDDVVVRSACCPADFNRDGFTDGFDYDAFVACFEGAPCPPGQTADFNHDGFADIFDFDDYVNAFEVGC